MNNTINYKRYSRQILMPEIGVSGQTKLLNSRVLVVGCGGLGAPVSLYLTAAGIGNIGLVEYDEVDESNLQRQVLYTTDDLGKEKIILAKKRLEALSPCTNIEIYNEKLTIHNALEIISKYDVVVDCTDNFNVRYIIGDACYLSGIPEVYGAVFRFDGQVTILNTKNSPTYRELFPIKPSSMDIMKASEGGIIGTLPGIIGAIQANEVIKLIIGTGNTLEGRLLVLNALTMNFKTIKLSHQININVNVENEEQFKVYNQNNDEELNSANIKELRKKDLKEFISKNNSILIDVREPFEFELNTIEGAINIPLYSIANKIKEISDRAKHENIILFCDSGDRSRNAANILKGRNVSSFILMID
ncbi:TPA: ThiF family adenylyltransferase [Salmonella enterica subsp. enterica serovar Muenchen]